MQKILLFRYIMDQTILILYGSESGTAQDLAEHIWRKLYDLFAFELVTCLSFDDYQIGELSTNSIAIFVVATSGQGEIPTNMRNNWRYLLSRKLGLNWLKNLNFAVLALGDSSYSKYNFAGKKLHRRLLQLGAKPILELALADEQDKLGIDEAFEKWLPELISHIRLMRKCNESTTSQLAIQKEKPKFLIEFPPTCLPDSCKYYPVQIIANDRVTDLTHFQDTHLIAFSTKEMEEHLNYLPGDVLMVLPENLHESIEISLNSLKNCNNFLGKPFHICRANSNIPLHPQYTRFFDAHTVTFMDSFRFYFDLQSIPKRSFIHQLANLSGDQIERDRLFELSSEEGMEDYLDYCHRSRRTLAELLRDFPKTSAHLMPQQLFDFFPVIRPRAFSIASSPRVHPGKIQILVARVEYKVRRMAEPRLGLCSNFLCSSAIGAKVLVRIRPGIFKYRENEPLLLVGPGTGIAPLRSIIAENEIINPGHPILLFFGCRSVDKDFYFKDEWPKRARTKIITAFSREQKEKIYVQHKIISNANAVWEILKNDGRVLIAGSAGEMPRAVVAALKQVVREMGRVTEKEAEEHIDKMERNGRILYETWG